MKLSLTLLLLVLHSLLPAQPASPPDAAPNGEERLTEITSDKLLFDYPNKIAVFTGNVVVTDPDMQITADMLTIHLNADDTIDRIVARGTVIIKSEGLHSRSGIATYILSEQIMLLEDRPQVFRERSVLTAERITYNRLEQKILAEPQPRLLMFQDADREFQLGL